jgi:hypothetical protein
MFQDVGPGLALGDPGLERGIADNVVSLLAREMALLADKKAVGRSVRLGVPHQNVLHSKNERVETCFAARDLDKLSAMIFSLRHLIGWVIGALGSRRDLLLENLALRQQHLSLHAKCPRFDEPQLQKP